MITATSQHSLYGNQYSLETPVNQILLNQTDNYDIKLTHEFTDNSKMQLIGATYTLIRWRYGATIPGLVNFQAPANPPVFSYTPIQTFYFKSTTDYVHTDYDVANKPYSTGNGSYKIGSYAPDSIFFGGVDPSSSYGHQYKEGYGLKLPPGYKLDLGEYLPSRISKDGQYIYDAQAGDRVFKRN